MVVVLECWNNLCERNGKGKHTINDIKTSSEYEHITNVMNDIQESKKQRTELLNNNNSIQSLIISISTSKTLSANYHFTPFFYKKNPMNQIRFKGLKQSQKF